MPSELSMLLLCSESPVSELYGLSLIPFAGLALAFAVAYWADGKAEKRKT